MPAISRTTSRTSARTFARVITADAHHKIAKGYMTAFYRQHLRNEAQIHSPLKMPSH